MIAFHISQLILTNIQKSATKWCSLHKLCRWCGHTHLDNGLQVMSSPHHVFVVCLIWRLESIVFLYQSDAWAYKPMQCLSREAHVSIT